jgi:hypothetical protein
LWPISQKQQQQQQQRHHPSGRTAVFGGSAAAAAASPAARAAPATTPFDKENPAPAASAPFLAKTFAAAGGSGAVVGDVVVAVGGAWANDPAVRLGTSARAFAHVMEGVPMVRETGGGGGGAGGAESASSGKPLSNSPVATRALRTLGGIAVGAGVGVDVRDLGGSDNTATARNSLLGRQ